MSSDADRDLAGEIAYVRTLAEEGRNAPLIGGVIYLVWGLVIGLASFLTWLSAAKIIALPNFVGGSAFWVIALACGWGLTFLIGKKVGGKPGALTIGNQTAMAAWFGVGVFMLIYWFSLLALHDRFEADGVKPYALFGTMFPVAFGVYGIAFYATATAARLDWLRGFAAAAWIFSVASLYFFSDARQLLVASVGSLVCAALPGFILMRREPSDIV
ncbi:MAG: hypothetical protein AB7F91_02595 [Parvularculaceae bacterium]|nr:hypothetical protein [Parvularculaceae bacterium]